MRRYYNLILQSSYTKFYQLIQNSSLSSVIVRVSVNLKRTAVVEID